MSERLLTPSKITSWLGCAHSLSLSTRVASGQLTVETTRRGELAGLLIEKGIEHESHCLSEFEAAGRSVYQVPLRNEDESFLEWVERVGNPMETGFDVIYQMPLVHDGVRGIADFLIRVDAESGYSNYEPVDAKLTRSQAKPGHVLQLCFYAEAMGALIGRAPRRMHVWLGSGDTEALLVEEFLPYWRRLRRQFATLIDDDRPGTTRPQLCDTCEYCEFHDHCSAEWRDEDSLAFLATARAVERAALEVAGVRTVVSLATRREPVADLREEKRERLTRQAGLQVASRESGATRPAFELIEPSEDPVYGHGFDLMPEPDPGDVYFDFEGDPFWTPRHDLMFLAGLYYRDGAAWRYDERWAHDLDEQRAMIRGLVDFFAERRTRFPAMHVYHYNHTERSTIERLTRGVEDENRFASLVETGLFVDLFTVARNAVRVGVESYGLKNLERLVGFERRAEIGDGTVAVVEYEKWLQDRDPGRLRAIADYNRDDVAATLALRDWLVAQRPRDLAWREPVITKEPFALDTDELVAGLHEFPESAPEHLLGDLLNYWRRERSADVTPKFLALNGDFTLLYDNIDFITNLRVERVEEPTGRARTRRLVLSWPEQKLDNGFADGGDVLYAGPGVEYGFATIVDIDLRRRELSLRWGAFQEELGGVPAVITRDKKFPVQPKDGVVKDIARKVLEPDVHGSPSRLAMSLLARERPRFRAGAQRERRRFSDDLDDVLSWVGQLDESIASVQGPPGAGKTYTGSHIIHELVAAGQRVGVVAMNHAAIDNLMLATRDVFVAAGDLDRMMALRWHREPGEKLDFATYSSDKRDLAGTTFNLIGGTAWLWANDDMRQNPVDVLLVDEAGQLSLADALASTNGARNMILLGDPLQLSQVAKAEHPRGSGASVLQHVLGEHPTIPETDGVFISRTWRMHPDVCEFISNQIYEGRLSSHESCRRQGTQFGTGLRWLEARHVRRSTESPEEADVVCDQIAAMVGTTWTDQHGVERDLRGRDFMVVAPYNDQVNLLRERLGASGLGDVQVGTVDKFQGREAPVVFFTMATSSAEDMPRGPEFLFSRNRLNVAVSRARCLAYLVCTEDLLNSRARDLDDMRLISTLSAFVEYAIGEPGALGRGAVTS